MAVTVTSTLRVGFNSTISNSVGLAAGQGAIDETTILNLASGVGADQADRVFSERDKAISGNYDVDLAGVLTDLFGSVITFARVKALYVKAAAANTGNVIMGAAGATIWFGPFGANTHTLVIRPGQVVLLAAPDATAWPVGAGATDLLRFAPSSGTQTFSWAVLGASA